jgi:hypothetical protein
VPVEVVGDPAAEGGADGGRHHYRHAVEREGLAAFFNGEGVGEDGLFAGGQAASAEALQYARHDQQRQRLRQAAQHGADGKHRHAGHVEALAPDAVGEPAGDGQDDGARHQVAGEDPGGFVLAGAEGAGHVRQRHVGDGGVEHLHERGQGHRDGDGPRVVVRLPVQLVEDQLRHGPPLLVFVFDAENPSFDSKGPWAIFPNCG